MQQFVNSMLDSVEKSNTAHPGRSKIGGSKIIMGEFRNQHPENKPFKASDVNDYMAATGVRCSNQYVRHVLKWLCQKGSVCRTGMGTYVFSGARNDSAE